MVSKILGQLSFFGKPEKKSDSLESKLDWKEIAKIALPRFPELQRGERISCVEMRRRLRDLQRAGFPVKKNYWNMRQEELYTYLIYDIRPYVGRMAEQHCPKIVKIINQKNREIKERAYLLK